MVTVNCLNCGKPFTQVRSTKKFCSDSCKTIFCRTKKNNQTQPLNIDPSPIQVPVEKVGSIPFGMIPPFDPTEKYAMELGYRLLEWCKDKPLHPEDVFVWLNANWKKKPIEIKKAEVEVYDAEKVKEIKDEPGLTYFEKRQRMKQGLK